MDRRFTADLLAEFAAEAQERLDRLEELLLALPGAAREERPGLLAAARLELHTLKGNAGMMGLSEQQVLAHELEDLTEEVDLTAPSVTPLLAGVDRFRMLVQESLETLGAGAPTASAAGPEGTAEVAATSVRIPFTVLDGLVDQLAEVVIIRNRLADALTGIGPLSSLFRQLSRIVHDTSAEEGKEVRFETAGADTPLDKALVELASDALGHLVRNAIIHGIEPPAERRRSGKPAAGTLRLEAVASPREVRIDVLDDGGGVDE